MLVLVSFSVNISVRAEKVFVMLLYTLPLKMDLQLLAVFSLLTLFLQIMYKLNYVIFKAVRVVAL